MWFSSFKDYRINIYISTIKFTIILKHAQYMFHISSQDESSKRYWYFFLTMSEKAEKLNYFINLFLMKELH